MADVGSVFVKFGSDTSGFTRGNREVQAGIDKTGKTAGQLGGIMKGLGATMLAGLSVGLIANFGKKLVELSQQAAQAEAKVEQAVKQTGAAAGYSADQLKRMSTNLERVTTKDGDDILNDVTAQLLTFTNITGENFKRAQVAIMDVATLLGGDLKGAAIQVGKALNEPLQSLSALTRSGIQFSASQKETIKNLVNSNQLFKAQSIILDEINRQYGGQAAKMASLPTGKIEQMQVAVENLGEAFGDKLARPVAAVAVAIHDLIDPMNRPINEKGWLGQMLQFYRMSRPGWVEKMAKQQADDRKSDEEFAKFQDEAAKKAADNAAKGLSALGSKIDTIQEIENEIKRLKEITIDADESELSGLNRKIKAWETEKARLESLGVAKTELAKIEVDTTLTTTAQLRAAIDALTKQQVGASFAQREAIQTVIDKYLQWLRIAETPPGATDWIKKLTASQPEKLSEASTDGSKTLAKPGAWMGLESLNKLQKAAQDEAYRTKQAYVDLNQVIGGGSVNAFDSLAQSLADLGTGQITVQTFFYKMLITVADFMKAFGAALVSAALASEAFQKSLIANPYVALGAGIALIGAAAVVRSIGTKNLKGYESGGVFRSPTVGVFGEYPGARTNPEVAGKLSDLKQVFGGGSVNGKLYIEGRDLVYVFGQELNRQSRM